MLLPGHPRRGKKVGFKGKDASEEEHKVLITSDHVSLDRLVGLAGGRRRLKSHVADAGVHSPQAQFLEESIKRAFVEKKWREDRTEEGCFFV